MLPIIQAIPALKDNYIWTIIHPVSHCAVLVDPGDATAAIHFLEQQQLKLAAVFITHRHTDHTNGIAELVEKYNISVYGPKKDLLPGYTHLLNDNDQIVLKSLELQFQIIAVPGHTHGHISFYGHDSLFSGDTLFSAGCGRLFEGTADQLFTSLSRLAKLPSTTKVYCGHEYTLNNLRFAAHVEPTNPDIQTRLTTIESLRADNRITLPSTIAIEQQTNPFLRCSIPSVHEAAEIYSKKKLTTPVEVFAVLRSWKDIF